MCLVVFSRTFQARSHLRRQRGLLAKCKEQPAGRSIKVPSMQSTGRKSSYPYQNLMLVVISILTTVHGKPACTTRRLSSTGNQAKRDEASLYYVLSYPSYAPNPMLVGYNHCELLFLFRHAQTPKMLNVTQCWAALLQNPMRFLDHSKNELYRIPKVQIAIVPWPLRIYINSRLIRIIIQNCRMRHCRDSRRPWNFIQNKCLRSGGCSHESGEYCHGGKADAHLDQEPERVALCHIPLAHRSGGRLGLTGRGRCIGS